MILFMLLLNVTSSLSAAAGNPYKRSAPKPIAHSNRRSNKSHRQSTQASSSQDFSIYHHGQAMIQDDYTGRANQATQQAKGSTYNSGHAPKPSPYGLRMMELIAQKKQREKNRQPRRYGHAQPSTQSMHTPHIDTFDFTRNSPDDLPAAQREQLINSIFSPTDRQSTIVRHASMPNITNYGSDVSASPTTRNEISSRYHQPRSRGSRSSQKGLTASQELSILSAAIKMNTQRFVQRCTTSSLEREASLCPNGREFTFKRDNYKVTLHMKVEQDNTQNPS